jgi:hypothetical protein
MQSARDRWSRRLIAEIETYVRIVDAFRREGCEPRSRREQAPVSTPRTKEATC